MNIRQRELLRDGAQIAARDERMAALQNAFEYATGEAFHLNAVLGTSRTDMYTHPEEWVEQCLSSLTEHAFPTGGADVLEPLIVMAKPYDVCFMDRLFGCEVVLNADSGEWYSRKLDTGLGNLREPDLERNETWILAKRIAMAFLGAGVTLPYFSMPTIASPLNVLVNLYGEEALMGLLLEPEDASHDLEIITRTQIKLHRWYRDHIPPEQLQCTTATKRLQPPGHGQLCGCSTQLVSADTYRDIILPFDELLLNTYENGGLIHLCGKHLQHMDAFRNMQSLRALQLNDQAAADLAQYHAGLRPDQVLYILPCEAMPARKARELCGGRSLVLIDPDAKQ